MEEANISTSFPSGKSKDRGKMTCIEHLLCAGYHACHARHLLQP